MNQGQPRPTEAQAPVEVEVPAVAAGDDPATDPPEPATAAPTVSDQAAPAADVPEAEALTTSEEPATAAHPMADAPEAAIPTPEADVIEAHPAPEVSEPVPTAPEVVADTSPHAEEYGIAPSAFSTTAPESEPAESREPVVPDPIEPTPSEPEPVRTAELVANATATGPDDDWPDGRRPVEVEDVSPPLPAGHRQRVPGRRDPGGCVLATLRPSPRQAEDPRAVLDLRDPRREDAARRAFGRTVHVRRTWRARSPPSGHCH